MKQSRTSVECLSGDLFQVIGKVAGNFIGTIPRGDKPHIG